MLLFLSTMTPQSGHLLRLYEHTELEETEGAGQGTKACRSDTVSAAEDGGHGDVGVSKVKEQPN